MEKVIGEKIDLVLYERVEADETRKWVKANKYNMVLHDTDIVVGHCDARLGYNENIYYGGHLGYFVKSEYRGNGYALEAVNLLKEVFKKYDIYKVYITNSPDNLASVRVCQKAFARLIEVALLPADNQMRVEDGDTHKNIFELEF